MTFNADKQCWEGSEDFPDDMLGQPETNAEAEGRRISQSSIAGSVIGTVLCSTTCIWQGF